MVGTYKLPENYKGYVFSEGTLNVDDLLARFAQMSVNSLYRRLLHDFNFKPEYYTLFIDLYLDAVKTDLTDEDKCNLWDSVCNFLNDIAPENSYFGAHEGDGACFGFWENIEEPDTTEQLIQYDADVQHVKYKQFLSDVRKLVDYNYDEEFKHMTELESDGQLTNDHIFFTIDKIQKFLEETETSNGTN